MKMRSGLTIAGTALAFALVAHTAEASTTMCEPGGGGGPEQPSHRLACGGGGFTPIVTTIQTATSSYNVHTEVEDGYDLLQLGEVIEVEIDVDTVIASLKGNPEDAMKAAIALGVRSNDGAKSGVMQAIGGAPTSSTKLSEGELKQVATLLRASMQSGGKAKGRSDPAGPSTSRVQATIQAISRAINSFASSLGLGSFTGVAYSSTRIEYHANGQRKSEFTQTIEIAKVRPK